MPQINNKIKINKNSPQKNLPVPDIYYHNMMLPSACLTVWMYSVLRYFTHRHTDTHTLDLWPNT